MEALPEKELASAQAFILEIQNALSRMTNPGRRLVITMTFRGMTHTFLMTSAGSIGRKDGQTIDPKEFPNHIGIALPNETGIVFSRKLLTIEFTNEAAMITIFPKAANVIFASRLDLGMCNEVNTCEFYAFRARKAAITFLLVAKQIGFMKVLATLVSKAVYTSKNDECWKIETLERGEPIALAHNEALHFVVPSSGGGPKEVLHMKLIFDKNLPTVEDDLLIRKVLALKNEM